MFCCGFLFCLRWVLSDIDIHTVVYGKFSTYCLDDFCHILDGFCPIYILKIFDLFFWMFFVIF